MEGFEMNRLIISPLTAEKMLIYQRKQASGELAIELVRYKNRRRMKFIGPIEVESSINNFLLTHDMLLSLSALGIKHTQTILSGGNSDRIRHLAKVIKSGRLPIIYVGEGAIGHWLTIWDFDREAQKFLVFDTSPKAEKERDASGLCYYGVDQVIHLSKNETLMQMICNKVGVFWPRFQILPGTLITA